MISIMLGDSIIVRLYEGTILMSRGRLINIDIYIGVYIYILCLNVVKQHLLYFL